ncbi:MAG: Cell cycle protein, partial [Petrotoga mobilis]
MVIKRNLIFYLIILGITLFVGVLFIYSSLFAISDIKEINPEQKFQTYIIALILGFLGAITAFMLSDTFTKNKHIMIALFTFLNLILVIVLFTQPIAGAKRWMNIGPFQFQPS